MDNTVLMAAVSESAGDVGILWIIGAGLAGLAIGLIAGQLIKAFFRYWNSPGDTMKMTMAVISFAFGGGAVGSTALFTLIGASGAAPCYLSGFGVGTILGYFLIPIPKRIDLARTTISNLGEELAGTLDLLAEKGVGAEDPDE